MMDARLKAGLLVQAILRLYDRELIPAVLRRRGDADAGAVLVKIAVDRENALLLSQARDAEGRAAWLRTGPAADAVIEAAIAKAIDRDPDIWVIEAEDPRGQLPFEAPILR
ncbi:DUF1491 family protein [Ferrovibrio sp.]|uniref:DUF1491 family protein n=1 Tax=Ferrovibrio sp. TaxID=1917215 RepID=UPI0025C4AC68|nr:DUF1491 family protein [Ferrovibrio sp.]MBX3453799.1 DUF1491 family protein [Ferrovibrio sp.]